MAAAEVFAEKGYEGAGVAEIARRAGFTTGAIYSRFAGKADLLAEAIKDVHAGRVRSAVRRARVSRAGPQTCWRPSARTSSPVNPNPAKRCSSRRSRPPVVIRRWRACCASTSPERAERLAALVDDGKSSGLVDPSLDTASIVHFAHAVGLGFLLFQAVGAENPDARVLGDGHSACRRIGCVPHVDDDIVVVVDSSE